MSSQESNSDERPHNVAEGADHQDDTLASKLSNELNNWRRRRTSRPKREDGPGANYQSEAARTIKLRGHETLVVRKPKLVRPAQP